MNWYPTDGCQCKKCTAYRSAPVTRPRYYSEEIPGTDYVTVYLHSTDNCIWTYSVYQGPDENQVCLATGELDLKGLNATRPQIARIVFLLEVENKS